jgi:hypothetical protein
METHMIQAVLEGGPVTLPTDSRTQQVNPDDRIIKVPHYGGYEHFERVGPSFGNADRPLVYQWVRRTRIAE